MHGLRRSSWLLRFALLAALLAAAVPVAVLPATAASNDPSDIVLVLDLSGSILDNKPVRTAFAGALDGIAARVEETSDTLVKGDATVSIVTFATRATDLPGCSNLQLRRSKPAVTQLAKCLRGVAATYRKGVDPVVTRAIGDDTNYVAAMERAASHFPTVAPRPAIIFFTDGKHEVAGVPVTQVNPARDRLFGARSPFALLPVGLGVDPTDRARLNTSLGDLRITRDMKQCDGVTPFDWPNVAFDTAEAAGQAVAVALQDVSCIFTVSGANPTPAPSITASVVRSISIVPHDGALEVHWIPPSQAAAGVTEYRVRCRPNSGGDNVEVRLKPTAEPVANVASLENGTPYRCEVAAVTSSGLGAWTAAPVAATPFGRPPAPSKPTVTALDRSARLGVTLPDFVPVARLAYECSTDGGTTWSVRKEVDGVQPLVLGGLANGTEYVCRATATNDIGTGDPSPLSDAFRPCVGFIGCNPVMIPVLGLLALLLVAILIWAWRRWYAGRQVWVTAQVDRFPSVTLGRGPNVGMRFLRLGREQETIGIAPDPGRKPEIAVRYRGGVKFDIDAPGWRVRTAAGREVRVTDREGVGHTLVVGAFDNRPPD
jgi:hypothetical protein